MYCNVMTKLSPNFNLVYTWDRSQFVIYNLKETFRPREIIPRESLISSVVESGCVEYDNKYYEINGTIWYLDRLPDWQFGTVYAIIEKGEELPTMFGGIAKATHWLVNMTPIMVAHDCLSVVDAYTIYRDQQSQPSAYRLCGFLIVLSKKRTIQDNILVTLTTEFERSLSLRPAVRYENFNLTQVLRDIENLCIPSIGVDYPNRSSFIEPIEYVSRDAWKGAFIPVNLPYCIEFYINFSLVTAEGYIPYYTIGCVGFGRLTVNDKCNPGCRLALQTSNCVPGYSYNARLDCNAPRIVTQWLFKHEYHLIKDFRGNETKVRYNCYY